MHTGTPKCRWEVYHLCFFVVAMQYSGSHALGVAVGVKCKCNNCKYIISVPAAAA